MSRLPMIFDEVQDKYNYSKFIIDQYVYIKNLDKRPYK
jgi:heme oxygenase